MLQSLSTTATVSHIESISDLSNPMMFIAVCNTTNAVNMDELFSLMLGCLEYDPDTEVKWLN